VELLEEEEDTATAALQCPCRWRQDASPWGFPLSSLLQQMARSCLSQGRATRGWCVSSESL